MHRPSRRTLAIVATAASVATGSLASTAAFAAVTDPVPVQPTAGALLGGLLPPVDTLAPAEIGDLLAPATGGDLTTLLGALDPAPLSSALATLSPDQLTALLAAATTTLAGTLPGADADALQDLIDLLQPLVPIALPGATPPGAAPPAAVTPPARTAPPSFAPRPGAPANTRYRARISRISVSKTRRVAKLRLTCPASAPKGCLVKVNGQVAGKRAAKAKWFLLLRNTSQTVTMKLTSASSKRLRTRGGTVRMSAKTYLTSMGTVFKTIRVKPARKR